MLKFLLLIGVIAAAYYGYKYYGRWEAAQAERDKQKAAAEAEAQRLRQQAPPAANPQPASQAAEMGGEDMVACPGCGTYRPVGAKAACDTPGCTGVKL